MSSKFKPTRHNDINMLSKSGFFRFGIQFDYGKATNTKQKINIKNKSYETYQKDPGFKFNL